MGTAQMSSKKPVGSDRLYCWISVWFIVKPLPQDMPAGHKIY